MKTYFSFAVADSMFPATCTVRCQPLTVEQVQDIIVAADVVSACNTSHAPTIDAMRERFGLTVDVPIKPPLVALQPGDRIVVMSVRGLPRLEGRHEYTPEEIESASFAFGLWTVATD